MSVQVVSTTRRKRRTALEMAGKGIYPINSGARSGMFRVRMPNGRDALGALQYKNYGPFAELADAIVARDKHLLAQTEQRTEALPLGRSAKPQTLREWAEHWLTYVLPMTAGISVQGKYRRAFERHILNEKIDGVRLGDIALVDLSTTHLQKWRGILAAQVGAPTLNYCIKRLKTCLAAATLDPRTTGIHVSPAAGKRITIETLPDRERYEPSEDDEVALLAQAGDDYRAPLITVATQTGLRVSELVALRWKDVHWEARQLELCWHLVTSGSVKGGDLCVAFRPGTKASGGGFETVELDDESLEALRLVRERLLEHKLQAGKGWKAGLASEIIYARDNKACSGTPYIVPERPTDDDALIFPALDGEPYRTAALGAWFDRIAHKAGLDKSIHKLRDDCGSILLANNVPVAVVSKHLRHKNIQTTLKHYAHQLKDDRRLAADTFANLRARRRALAEQAV